VLNHYGPPEATVGVSTFEVTAESAREAQAVGAGTVPLGLPLANGRLHVLDGQGRPVPLGVSGEL
jgi:non-ribosomal peptide synthetase component F